MDHQLERTISKNDDVFVQLLGGASSWRKLEARLWLWRLHSSRTTPWIIQKQKARQLLL